ncbi:head GIN domain-containing protein [Parapedobacter sp. GCM10030251]|uniref:head GIN domain-containing protein n=1 Tax=Parapedobacter sp. GCM10030251 TaxID=3273419 RepID=UPI0036237B63
MKRELSVLCWLALSPVICMGWIHVGTNSSFRDDVRDVRDFHALASAGSINVEVRFGDRESVRLVGDAAAIAEVETLVEKGTLKIQFKKNAQRSGLNRGKVTAYVTAKKLDALALSGSGAITVVGTASGDEMNASLSGSGKLTFEPDVEVCNVSISGSGRIAAAGQAKEINVSLSGSGRFEGGELKSQSANLKIAGSGTITVHADKQVDAFISGSGNIRYSGNAQTNVQTSGSGRIHRL